MKGSIGVWDWDEEIACISSYMGDAIINEGGKLLVHSVGTWGSGWIGSLA